MVPDGWTYRYTTARINDCSNVTYITNTSNAFVGYDDWVFTSAEIRKGFRAFLELLAPRRLEPNPLRILMRAVNTIRLRVHIRQPCWRAGRWRSLT
jgi:hypothetical protein